MPKRIVKKDGTVVMEPTAEEQKVKQPDNWLDPVELDEVEDVEEDANDGN